MVDQAGGQTTKLSGAVITAKMPRIPFTPAEVQARAVQLENDQAALFLVRRAIQLEGAASRAGDAGNMTSAKNKMQQARTFCTVAGRLVLKDRPPSLGRPPWLEVGTLEQASQEGMRQDERDTDP